MENILLEPKWNLNKEGKRIIYLTPSILKNINCNRFFFLSSLVGLAKKGEYEKNYKAAYGNAFGMFCDDYHCNVDFELARKRATDYYQSFDSDITDEKEWRTLSHLHRTIFKYSREVPRTFFIPIEIERNKAVQVTVDVPFVEYEQYVFHLAGTLDKLAAYSQYPICVVDDKTTGSYDIKGFFNQFNINLQVMSYVYLATKFLDKGEDWLPFVVNGIFLKKNTIKAEKEGIFDGATFLRHGPEFVPTELMESFIKFIKNICNNLNREMMLFYPIDNNAESLFHNPNYSCCAGHFGKGCVYSPLCRLGSLEQMLPVIPSNFTNGNFSPTITGITGDDSNE